MAIIDTLQGAVTAAEYIKEHGPIKLARLAGVTRGAITHAVNKGRELYVLPSGKVVELREFGQGYRRG
jgi:hypothetical protein